jgi:hypothetical protein
LGSNASGKSGWMQLLAGMVPNSLITAAMLADTAAPKKLGEVILGSVGGVYILPEYSGYLSLADDPVFIANRRGLFNIVNGSFQQ